MYGSDPPPPGGGNQIVVHSSDNEQGSAIVVSWEDPPNTWLTAAKNAFVGWAFNFRVRVLLKSAVTPLSSQAPQIQNTWCMRQFVYIENFIGKSPIVKKKCVNNYLIWNKVFLPQMCRELVSCADLKPFWRRLVELFETVTPPTKRRQNGFKIGTRDKFATHLR